MMAIDPPSTHLITALAPTVTWAVSAPAPAQKWKLAWSDESSGVNGLNPNPEKWDINLAVGGDWPGNPDLSTRFPQQMLVDYVRVYKSTAAPPGHVVHALSNPLTP